MITRIFRRIAPNYTIATLTISVLLVSVLLIMIVSLAEVVRGLEAILLAPFTLLALLLGWWLGHGQRSGWLVALIVLLSGISLLLIQTGQVYDELLITLWQTLEYFWGVIVWIANQLYSLLPGEQAIFLFPSHNTMAESALALFNSFEVMLSRLWNWFSSMVRGYPAYDPFANIVWWGFLVWCISAWTGWMIKRRQRPFLAVLPALGLIAITYAYEGKPTMHLSILIGFAFLLVGIVRADIRRKQWETKQIDYAPILQLDASGMVAFITLVLVLLASFIPSISFRKLVRSFRELADRQVQEEPITRSLGLEPGQTQKQVSVFDKRRHGGLPSAHLLSGSPDLQEEVFLVVTVNQPPIWGYGPYGQQEVPRYYWRSVNYNVYTGNGWWSSPTDTFEYDAGDTVVSPTAENQQLLRQEVQIMAEDVGILYVSGTLVSVDHPFEVAFRTTPSTANIKDYFGATTKASSYRVDSLVPNYTTQELRQAGEEYPEWVLDRYLALPANLPARVRSLALELTAAEATPYDRAVAIEKHLRQFPYSLDVPLPPRDEDVVDYFLFTLQEGYCDYYASAMVVLARAAGIPARLVTGYTSATFDSTNNRYIVKESEAHAWVDIYFPGYGWIEFEPTAGRPPIERQENLPDTVSMQPSDQLEEITAYRTRLNWTIWIISLGIGWIVIFWSIALYRWLESWHLRRIPPKQAIQKIYNQFRDRARVLSSDHIPGVTPHEFAEILKIRLTGLTKRPRLLASLSNAPNEILSLTEVYTRAVYSQERLSPQESQLAIQTWRKLRSRLVLAQWLLRFRI